MQLNLIKPKLSIFTGLSLLLAVLISPQVSAKTFFMDEEEELPSGYYNNEDLRSEKIKSSKAKKKNYSRKHNQIAEYLNSYKEPLASDVKWSSEKALQIGVIKRYRTEEYAKYACKVIDAFDMESEGVKVRIIFLPNLVTYNRLELLAEHKCV
ncbi:hypothetical protein ACMXYQ_10070 [Neptuniibacter sp. PT34_22]|uniref:hypothetical protein n=1 Tax=Neptuniibacter sp. PT34_22 TaxID=3398205 RepID=UPI0039F61F9F